MLEEKRVFIVADENKIVEVIKSYLEKEGAIVFEAYDGNQALEIFERINRWSRDRSYDFKIYR